MITAIVCLSGWAMICLTNRDEAARIFGGGLMGVAVGLAILVVNR